MHDLVLATKHDAPPGEDEGTFLVDGAQPISFDHIEVLQLNFNPYSLPDDLEPNDNAVDAESIVDTRFRDLVSRAAYQAIVD